MSAWPRCACQTSSPVRPAYPNAATITSGTRRTHSAISGSTCSACSPTKWATRRSPPPVAQPSSGIPAPPSGAPTVCAPIVISSAPPASDCACSGVGAVIR
ncbi:hypothetical protein ABZ917_46420 [Nonomuraea wenchangensis]